MDISTNFYVLICILVLSLVYNNNIKAQVANGIRNEKFSLTGGPKPDPPGVKLKKEGLKAKHPVVFVPGIVTGGLELWEGRQCADGLFRKRLWGGTFGDAYKRPLCWIEHMHLDNVTGLDPAGIRMRAVNGLVNADYFTLGYAVWAVLIDNLAQIGYEEKNMYMAAYDWRLSLQNTEVRDKTLSRMKSNIELMVAISGEKAVVVPHSMGSIYFLHFMKWVEAPPPMGGGGGPDWCAKHIKSVVNIGAPLLGAPKSVPGLFSAEAKKFSLLRTLTPDFLDTKLLALQRILSMSRSWDSTMALLPKGGDVIWGGLDWSPEDVCVPPKPRPKKVDPRSPSGDEVGKRRMNYGRLLSFGRDVADGNSSQTVRANFRGAVKGESNLYNNCEVWTEYHQMGLSGLKAVADYKTYTPNDIVDLLTFVAPSMMTRGGKQYSYGIADNLNDPKYADFKYWSNPLETKLPNAPDMEMFSLYGRGLPTERAYVYMSQNTAGCELPFQIDTSATVDDEGFCLKDGVFTVDGDATVPILSAGYMFAKGWRGKTRFNPSGIKTYIREFDHSPPANFLEGRGTMSAEHVNIMGNYAVIEDVMKIATGTSGVQLGGDQVYSDIFQWSEKIKLPL